MRLEHGHHPGPCASVLGQFHSRSFVCLLFSFFIAKELKAPCGLDPLGVGVTGTDCKVPGASVLGRKRGSLGARRVIPGEEGSPAH